MLLPVALLMTSGPDVPVIEDGVLANMVTGWLKQNPQAAQEPPQSTPVSVPFREPSKQEEEQAGHVPPQSIPVSVPFFIPSEQVGAQAGQDPPQSMPVSVPFLMPSVQLEVGQAASLMQA